MDPRDRESKEPAIDPNETFERQMHQRCLDQLSLIAVDQFYRSLEEQLVKDREQNFVLDLYETDKTIKQNINLFLHSANRLSENQKHISPFAYEGAEKSSAPEHTPDVLLKSLTDQLESLKRLQSDKDFARYCKNIESEIKNTKESKSSPETAKKKQAVENIKESIEGAIRSTEALIEFYKQQLTAGVKSKSSTKPTEEKGGKTFLSLEEFQKATKEAGLFKNRHSLFKSFDAEYKTFLNGKKDKDATMILLPSLTQLLAILKKDEKKHPRGINQLSDLENKLNKHLKQFRDQPKPSGPS